ncbi:GAP1-N2 domain-containing protein [Aporhodopirellula aestuarii]|uniref:Uncharacterized protein n=1 Tax=Aporhodopirellula aestuarii TaxID=2950107 RepID=A0ABT0U4P4_9BACT|nr:hypothetical protein [Aporhodopirellula aestuarii]MCM2371868.1 hypothetical protein [Aporhodopirellula aestuarii]
MSKSSELVYTSAPRGLRPGSRGFCTVAMSESMPAGLVGPLESLSAYRHADGDGQSPVNYMHVRMKVAGRPVNVLSRIAEAPPDYTGRTNKIAYHVVVATTAQAAGGPAAVLRQPGFAIEAWDGEVRKIPELKTIPQADSPQRIAQTWARLSGDAGWAGTVASIFESQAPGPPLYLIYRPEQNADLLALVDEAICLLPESKRWNATFSTHTGELPPGVNCRLRCMIAGSPEALAVPPTAMTLDIASGNLGTPPPSPLVDAARSGQFALSETVGPAAVPAASTPARMELPESTGQPTVSDTGEPRFPVPPPELMPPQLAPPQLRPGQLPPPFQPKSSPFQNHVWALLGVAALLLLCLGGGVTFYLLRTDSDDLLAELNAAAGIENPPEVNVSANVEPEPDVELEPEPVMEPRSAADANADAKAAEPKQADDEKRKSLEDLAKRILDGEAFLGNDHENSITKFSKKVKNELTRLNDRYKQLYELSLQPTDEQLAMWARAEDGEKQLASFIEARKQEIEALKQHVPLNNLQADRERLVELIEIWKVDAKKWEDDKQKQPGLILRLSNRVAVEQTIKKVRATEKDYLQKGQLKLYEELSAKKIELAESLEKQLDPKREELATELKRRRDSHRLLIHFDGDSSRNEDRLQIRPRCEISVNADNLKAINRVKVDDGDLIQLPQSNVAVKLPGRFEGWLSVTRGASEIILKFNLNQKNIPPAVRQRYPILQQLDRFVEQQDVTFESSRILRTAFLGKSEKAKSDIEKWRNEVKRTEGKERREEERRKKEADKWNAAIDKLTAVVIQSPAGKLDELYITQSDQTVIDLKSVKLDIVQVFSKFVTPNVAIGTKIDEHIENLEMLRDSYDELMRNEGVLDFGARLDFGYTLENTSRSATTLGQKPKFITVETFELFFFPELVYGPPN